MEKQEDYSDVGKDTKDWRKTPKALAVWTVGWRQWGGAEFSSFILLSTDDTVCHTSRKFSTTTK